MYYGQSRRLSAYIHNTGTKPAAFTTSVVLNTVEAIGFAHLVITPHSSSEADVPPGSSLPLSIQLTQPLDEARIFELGLWLAKYKSLDGPADGVSPKPVLAAARTVQFTVHIGQVATGEAEQTLVLAELVPPMIRLSSTIFQFAECQLNAHVERTLELTNDSTTLPLPFRFSNVQYFQATPSSGVLQPRQQQKVALQFIPTQDGTVQTTVQLVLCDNLLSVPIAVSGTGSTTAAPPVSQRRCPPSPLPPAAATGEHTVPRTAESDKPLKQKADDVPSRRKRAGGSYALAFLSRTARGSEGSEVPGGLAPVATPANPEGRVFKPLPTTSAEIRECSMRHSAVELSSVATFGAVRLDCGAVVAEATVVVPFLFTNRSKHHLLVEVGPSDVDQDDTVVVEPPASQVIPPGATARFALRVTPHQATEPLRRTLRYTINRTHTHAITVEGEVVRPTLGLSTDRVQFVLDTAPLVADDEGGVLVHRRSLELINPHRQPIDYRWVLPDAADSPFRVQPVQGTALPLETVAVEVLYTPDSRPHVAETMTLVPRGGVPIPLHCKATLPAVVCGLSRSSLDFGLVAVGSTHTKVVRLRNKGAGPASFVAGLPVDEGPAVKVVPARGMVLPGKSVLLKVVYSPPSAGPLQATLALFIPGHKQLAVALQGVAASPDVCAASAVVEFGEVWVGAAATRTVQLRNTSPVPASLWVDMAAMPLDFCLLPMQPSSTAAPASTQAGQPEVDVGEPVQDVVSSQLQPVPVAPSRWEAFVRSAAFAVQKIDQWELHLPPYGAADLVLQWTPSGAASAESHPFPLQWKGRRKGDGIPAVEVRGTAVPLDLAVSTMSLDFGSVPWQGSSEPVRRTLAVRVSAGAAAPLEPGLGWRVEHDPLETAHFAVHPLSGVLSRASATAEIAVHFQPRAAGSWKSVLRLYVAHPSLPACLAAAPFREIRVQGEALEPDQWRLEFDCREVVLPLPCRPGEVATTVFTIENKGYPHHYLQHLLPSDADHIPLQIEYPDGRTIGTERPAVSVQVSFRPDKPLSFTAPVQFVDSARGKVYSVIVTGQCDTSSLSRAGGRRSSGDEAIEPLTAFVQWGYGTHSRWAAEQQPWWVGRTQRPAGHEEEEEQVVGWLNHLLLPQRAPVREFPDDLCTGDNAPRYIFEVVERVSGRRVPGVLPFYASSSSADPPAGSPPTMRRSKAEVLVHQYTKLLGYLRGQGCVLPLVDPAMLLPSWEDYEEWQAACGTPLERSRQWWAYYVCRCLYGVVQKEAWSALVLQIIRVFVLARVSAASLRAALAWPPSAACADLPAYARRTPKEVARHWTAAAALAGGDTTPEEQLLVWAETARRMMGYDGGDAATTSPQRPSFSGLRDCVQLSHLVEYYASPLVQHALPSGLVASLYTPCHLPQHFDHNAASLSRALQATGLPFAVHARTLWHCGARPAVAVLLLLGLFMTLPHYRPQGVVQFAGVLQETVVRNVQLANPSKTEALAVEPLLLRPPSTDGTSDAHAQGFSLGPRARGVQQLSPLGRASVAVHYASKFSSPSTALLLLRARTAGVTTWAPPTLLVLHAIANTREPTATFRLPKAPLYELQELQLEVVNPLAVAGVFAVSLEQSLPPSPRPAGLAVPCAFWLPTSSVALAAGGKAVLVLRFLPFVLGTHKCRLLFTSPAAGEFVQEVEATATLPHPLDTVRMACEENTTAEKRLVVPENTPFQKALGTATQLSQAMGGPAWKPAGAAAKTYQVEYSSEYFGGPAEVTLGPGRGLTVGFRPHKAGHYGGQAVLWSAEDVVVVVLEGTCSLPTKVVRLEFAGPVRQTVTQDIPVVNRGSKPVTYTVALLGSSAFAGPAGLIVPGQSTGYYPLVFRPVRTGPAEATLTLANQLSGEKQVFQLSGHGEEPLAEDSVTIGCVARAAGGVVHTFRVPNILRDQPVRYRVETDLPYVCGPDELAVAGQYAEYSLSVRPLCSGEFEGAVSFIAPDGQYCWFHVTLAVTPPPPERTIELYAHEHSASVAELSVANPSPQAVEFEVHLEGDGLSGPSTLTVPGSASALYELVFLPTTSAPATEGAVIFVSPEVGEFWYLLRLHYGTSSA